MATFILDHRLVHSFTAADFKMATSPKTAKLSGKTVLLFRAPKEGNSDPFEKVGI